MNEPLSALKTASEEGLRPQPSLLVIVTGPTAVGKTEVGKRLLMRSPNLHRLITYTTRPPRVELGERDGVDYHFRKEDIFNNMKDEGQFLETASYAGNQYGTAKDSIELILKKNGEDLLWIIESSRASEIEETFRSQFDPSTAQALLDRTVIIHLGVPRLTILKDRYIGRGSKRKDLLPRLQRDWDLWNERKDKFSHVVINETEKIDETVNQIVQAINLKREEIAKYETSQNV